MPSPTTLTVKVPEGTDWVKCCRALGVALPAFHVMLMNVDDWDKSGCGPGTFLVSLPDWFDYTLNPNALDPEDAVLVARVLGAQLVNRTGQTYVRYHPDEHALAFCEANGDYKLEDWDDGFGPLPDTGCQLHCWRIHSIPSLGLTR